MNDNATATTTGSPGRRHADIVAPVPTVEAHITGTIWKVECEVGDQIADGDTVAVIESMKMEMPVESEADGTVAEIRCQKGQSVSEGDVLVVLR